jgi:hypothetical protein
MKAGMNVIRCNMSHGDHEDRWPIAAGSAMVAKLANLEKAYELAPEFKGKMKAMPDVAGCWLDVIFG